MLQADALGQDVRHALRAIARMPLLATVIVASLGVGIGMNTVVFSWIRGVVFQPLPGVRDAAAFRLIEPRTDRGMYPGASWLEYRDLSDELRAFDSVIAFRMTPAYIGHLGRLDRAYAMLVSGNYFTALGLRPALGRFIRPDEAAQPGRDPVAVLSFDYWRTRLAGDPAAIGRTIRISGSDFTIVGVAPRGFQGTMLGLAFDMWLPATAAPVVLEGSRELDDRSVRGYSVIGRLREDATPAQAQADLDVVMRRLATAYPATNASVRGEVLPFSQAPRGPPRFLPAGLAVLQGVMLLLLLAVCGNTANLVLARASARQRETGIRLALGARPWAVARLLLVENLVLASMGAAVGAAIAWWGAGTAKMIPPLRGMPIRFQTEVDVAALAFAALLGVLSGILFGAAPAVQLARADPYGAMRGGTRSAGRSRLRQALMAVQVALAMTILIVAALFMRSFTDTRGVDPGFARDGVLLGAYDLTGRGATPDSTRRFAAALLQRLRDVPGVRAAAIGVLVPLDMHGMPSRRVAIEGRAQDATRPDEALVNTVSPGYFDVMEIPFKSGSDFADLALAPEPAGPGTPAQAIVNETFVSRYLPGAEPIGRRVRIGTRDYALVGVVRDSLYNAFGEPPTPIVYLPYRNNAVPTAEVHARTAPGAETAIAADLRRIVSELDRGLPVYNVRTMGEHIEANLLFRRIPARLFAVLGPLILLLAAIGIYAVVAYAVSLRTSEIGVRMALGATARRVMVQLAGEHLALCAVGGMAGWVVALAAAADPGAPIDLAVFGGVPLLLMATATAACWAAVRRATAVDPLVALRED